MQMLLAFSLNFETKTNGEEPGIWFESIILALIILISH